MRLLVVENYFCRVGDGIHVLLRNSITIGIGGSQVLDCVPIRIQILLHRIGNVSREVDTGDVANIVIVVCGRLGLVVDVVLDVVSQIVIVRVICGRLGLQVAEVS